MSVQLDGRNAEFVNQSAATVWIRKSWTDEWQYVPFLEPVNASAAAMPAGSKATLKYKYGQFIYPDISSSPVTLLPEDISGWFVGIQLHQSWGSTPVFTGQIVSQSDNIGGCGDYVERGEITLDCYGLEYLLRQYDITGSYVYDHLGHRFCQKTLPVNKAEGFGSSLPKTKSSTKDSLGTYVFGSDEYWNNAEFLEYVLAHFQADGLDWRISGNAAWTLQQIVRPFSSYEGKSVLDVVGQMIDKYRGIGWRVFYDVGSNAPVIDIYSELATPMSFYGGFQMPANSQQTVLNDLGSALMDVEWSFSTDTMFDSITVIGDPVKNTGTWGLDYAGTQPDEGLSDIRIANLVPGWSRSLETGYWGDITDEQRKDKKYADLFGLWKIPDDFDWKNVTPIATPDGEIHINGYSSDSSSLEWGKTFASGLTFERNIPFNSAYADTTGFSDFWDEDASQPPVIVYSTGWKSADELSVSLEITPDDKQPGWRFDAKDTPHLMAAGLYAEAPENALIEPVLDMSKMLITASIELDTRPYMTFNLGWSPGTPSKPLVIAVPCRFEYMGKTPIVKVEDGSPVYFDGTQIYRDERSYLAGVLGMAVATYTVPRSPINATYRSLDAGLPVGSMITGVRNAARFRPSYSIVSAVHWDFQQRTTKVLTAHSELDVVRLGMGGM